jgi:hypothetical protein
MNRVRLLRLIAPIVLVGVCLSACATTVNHVLADPARYRNRDVTVAGRVADSVSLGGRGAYRLEDKTGSLWVVSTVGVPRTGARVKVKGRIHDAFNVGLLGGRINLPGGVASGVVMQERSHKAD